MKMHRLMRFSASVFLALLVFFTAFSSCGIPVLFHTDAAITPVNTNDDSIISFDISMIYPSELGYHPIIKKGTGPSILLSYVVTGISGKLEETIDNNTIRELIIKDFKKLYNPSFGGKSIIISEEDEPILKKEDSEGKMQYTLYPFAPSANIWRNSPNAPRYHITANDSTLPTSAKFEIEVITDNNDVSNLVLRVINGDYAINVADDALLHRYNTDSFAKDGLGYDYPDYLLEDTNMGRYCHIFAAINVSDGNFTNIYWSELEYLGYIEL